jgi:putative transposase
MSRGPAPGLRSPSGLRTLGCWPRRGSQPSNLKLLNQKFTNFTHKNIRMPTKKILTPIEPGNTYHIYNRGNNFQKVFFTDDDYQLFLERFKYYLKDYCSLYAFALLPNHYHFLLCVHENEYGARFSQQFMKFILSYTNKVNYKMNRNGSLFLARFRRIKVDTENYLRRMVYYIHHNPAKHKATEDYKIYKYSSYRIFLSDKPTALARDEALEFYGGLANYIEYHNYLHVEDVIKKLILEAE